MSFAAYRELLRVRGVLPLVLLALIARLPNASVGMAVTLHVVYTLQRTYAEAGIVAAAMTVGMFFGAPWRGRAVDRQGLRKALLPSILVSAACWGVMPWVSDFRVLIVVAVVAGIFMVPAFPVVRQSLAVLAGKERQHTAFSLDAVTSELTFVLSPLIVIFVCDAFSTRVALISIGVATAFAGVALMAMNPPTLSTQLAERRGLPAETPEASPKTEPRAAASDAHGPATPGPMAEPDAPPGPRRGLLGRLPAVSWPLIAVMIATGAIGFLFQGVDLSIVAILKEWDEFSKQGAVFALWSGSSAIGGLLYGAWGKSLHPLWLVLGVSIATIPLGLMPNAYALMGAVLVVGFLTAPSLSSINTSIASLVPEERRGEAMGWNGSAMTVASTIAAPIVGVGLDAGGGSMGFFMAGAVAAVLALLGLFLYGRKAAPSASGKSAA